MQNVYAHLESYFYANDALLLYLHHRHPHRPRLHDPLWVGTEIHGQNLPYLQNFDFGKRVPLNRVGEHQELANLATFLMSDHSAYINGEVVTIDGGEWLKGAGQFNMLEAIPENMWDMIESQVRKTKGS